MPYVLGVDGCRGGWIGYRVNGEAMEDAGRGWRLYPQFGDLIAAEGDAEAIVIDIPVGLLEAYQPGGRECDRTARKLLGRPRSSSVYSPPARPLLGYENYDEMRAAEPNHRLSRQAFGILPKVREVDKVMTPELQERIFEGHPELAFTTLGVWPMQYNKRTLHGYRERLRHLERLYPDIRERVKEARKEHPKPRVARDDFVDAAVLAWVAWRRVQGGAKRVPSEPPLDARGLRMEIWY